MVLKLLNSVAHITLVTKVKLVGILCQRQISSAHVVQMSMSESLRTFSGQLPSNNNNRLLACIWLYHSRLLGTFFFTFKQCRRLTMKSCLQEQCEWRSSLQVFASAKGNLDIFFLHYILGDQIVLLWSVIQET